MRLLIGLATVLFLPLLIAAALLVGNNGPGTQAAPLAGAIFTTTPDGGIVNENVHYEGKIEVYLDGGPGPNAPQTAAGLPDGDYVFQVTDPSGKVLLSEDPAKCRLLRVENGVIVALLNVGATYDPNGRPGPFPCHIQDAPHPRAPAGPGDAGTSGRHDTNTDSDHGDDADAIVVQLMPFFDTPNPGGVYKAWVIPVDRYLSNGGALEDEPNPACERRGRAARNCNGSAVQIGFHRDPGFGPPRDQVKTDNFKVKEFFPPEITVRKFHDINGDSIWQTVTEEEIDGWPYAFTEPIDGGTLRSYREFTPQTHVAGIPGTYNATEDVLSGWKQSAAYLDGSPQFPPLSPSVDIEVAGTSGETHEVIFGNFMPIEPLGQKFIDLDGNGQRGPGEDCPTDATDVNYPGCVNVTVHLDGRDNMGNEVHRTTMTCGDTLSCPAGDPNGSFRFLPGVNPGSYTITIDEPAGFECSFPGPSCDYTIDVNSGDLVTGLDFGDFSRAEVHGQKFIDLDGDGQRGPGEGCDPSDTVNYPGCANVTVHLDGIDGMGRPVHLTTATDQNGEYWFTDLWPGSYTIAIDEPPGFECSFPQPCEYTLALVSDDRRTNLEFGDLSRAEVHGKKVIDLNGDGDIGVDSCNLVPDPFGNNAGCQGVTVHLDGIDGMGRPVHLTTATDQNGEYRFTDLWPGTYTITIGEPAGFFCSFPDPCDYTVTLASDDVVTGLDFGDFSAVDIHAHKFFDLNENGVQDPLEQDLAGVQFCLTLEGGGPVIQDVFGNAIVDCQTTNDAGMVWWMDLLPGQYTVTETVPAGFFPTTPISVTVWLVSDETVTIEFGNVAHCSGLTPGYWKNWINHYSEDEILVLLAGTIAPTIDQADAIFEHYDASPGDEITIMRAMLLANQLTINLTQHPELPNTSDGSLFRVCQAPEVEETLGEVIDAALAIHDAAGAGFSRDEILRIARILDTFANL